MEQGKLRAFFERYIYVSFSRLTEQYQALESHTLQAQDLVRGLQRLLDATTTQLNHIEAKVDAISRARRHQLPERLLRLAEVQEMTGLNRNAVYNTEDFPKPVKISARATAWVLSEVQDWIQNQIEQQRAGERDD
jgi:prophage regulatory protein